MQLDRGDAGSCRGCRAGGARGWAAAGQEGKAERPPPASPSPRLHHPRTESTIVPSQARGSGLGTQPPARHVRDGGRTRGHGSGVHRRRDPDGHGVGGKPAGRARPGDGGRGSFRVTELQAPPGTARGPHLPQAPCTRPGKPDRRAGVGLSTRVLINMFSPLSFVLKPRVKHTN